MKEQLLGFLNDLVKSQGLALVVLFLGLSWMTFIDYHRQKEEQARLLYLEKKVDICNSKIVELLQVERMDIEEALRDLEKAIMTMENERRLKD